MEVSKTNLPKKRAHASDSDDNDSMPAILKARKLDHISGDSCSSDYVLDTHVTRDTAIGMQEPLQSCLTVLFKIFAQFAVCDELSPKVFFIYQLMSLLVHCGKDRIRPVLKLLPAGLVQNLLKVIVTGDFTVGFILR